ncbi:hypothetical protein [Palleronia rufa]|uniref:hypothetical protein n=1 Tax=Palleronia rufa TaxID=1530186 RepID=UPI0005681730|nr:hypothetical protein [Palleronia rufa]
MLCRILLFLILLSACGRPLSPGERAFVRGVQGPAIDGSRVRVHGVNPLYAFPMTRPPRPYVTCRERIYPPETAPVEVRVAATVLLNRIFVAGPVFRPDFLAGYPETADLPAMMLLAHELTHVWQWQRRDLTGYTPLKVAQEHGSDADPYVFDLSENRPFLSYPYEQQAGLVEEFVCCRALDPEAPRTGQLHRLLTPVFPALARRELVRKSNSAPANRNAPQRGICQES